MPGEKSLHPFRVIIDKQVSIWICETSCTFVEIFVHTNLRAIPGGHTCAMSQQAFVH